MTPPIPLDPSGLPVCEIRTHGTCCDQPSPAPAGLDRPTLITSWNNHAIWRVSEPNVSNCKRREAEWRSSCGVRVESKLLMPSHKSVVHAEMVRRERWRQMQKADAILANASCSADTTAASVASLQPDAVAALRWLFEEHAASDGKLSRQEAWLAVLRLEGQGQSWHDKSVENGGRREYLARRLMAKCGSAPSLTFEEFAWTLAYLGKGLVKFAVILMDATAYSEAVWAVARAENRTPTVCGTEVQLPGPAYLTINITRGRQWRYYSAFACSDQRYRAQVCLTFKEMVVGNQIMGLRLRRGRRAIKKSLAPLFRFPWDQSMFAHNHGILQLPNDTWVAVGGMEGFVTDPSCRRPRRHRIVDRTKCLRVVYTRKVALSSAVAKGGSAVVAGVRATQGRGWRWTGSTWDEPRVFLRGSDPPGCVDRRPHYNGYPSLQACEFDGRLSLVSMPSDSSFRLYARSNLRYAALAGGRNVQTTWSRTLHGGWMPWQAVRLLGVPSDRVDLYFFVVQRNPVDPTTLMALMPASEPPWACIALAFSRDGVNFSHPINLRNAPVGYRRHESTGYNRIGGFSARSEDHPVANVVFDPLSYLGRSHLLLYMHHAVGGTTYRDVPPQVAAYRLAATRLRRWTREGLQQL